MANVNSARGMVVGNDSRQTAEQSAVTSEVITWEGAAGGSSYIAQGVSPMAG